MSIVHPQPQGLSERVDPLTERKGENEHARPAPSRVLPLPAKMKIHLQSLLMPV